MFINSISPYQQNCTFRAEIRPEVVKNNYKMLTQHIMNSKRPLKLPEDSAEKKAVLDLLKMFYQIMLTQDIWHMSPRVKMPETPEEKTALLEILGFRAQLDRLVQLSHRKFKVMHDETISNESRANTLNAINKKLEEEKNRHKGAVEFFENIDNAAKMYVADEAGKETPKEDVRCLKIHRLTEFWDQIRINDINKEGKMSVQDLIECVKRGEKAEAVAQTVKPEAKKPDNIREKLEHDYEENLKRLIDVYSEEEDATAKNTMLARKLTVEANRELFNKHRNLKKILPEIFKGVEEEYKKNVDAASSSAMYPIGQIWKAMDEIERVAKETIDELNACEAVLAKNSEDKKAAKRADYLQKKLNNLKKEWLDGLTKSVQCEAENRARAAAAGAEGAYDYLVSQNANVIGQKSIMEELKSKYSNPNDIPWTEVFSVFLK